MLLDMSSVLVSCDLRLAGEGLGVYASEGTGLLTNLRGLDESGLHHRARGYR
jgi:hypothetical protein